MASKTKRPKRVCKFRPINKHTEDIFVNKNLFFGYVKDFNDPFEFSMNFSRSGFKSRQPVIYHSFKNAFTVLCITEEETKHDVSLWSHYSDFHRGICIEFTPDYENEKSPFHEIEPVRYLEEVPKPIGESEDDIHHYLKTILATKAKCWEYEKEWRVVRLNNYGDEVKEALSNGLRIDRGRLHRFNASELTKVILGCKVSEENERIALNWVMELENYEIAVEKCIIDETEYKLKFIQII